MKPVENQWVSNKTKEILLYWKYQFHSMNDVWKEEERGKVKILVCLIGIKIQKNKKLEYAGGRKIWKKKNKKLVYLVGKRKKERKYMWKMK